MTRRKFLKYLTLGGVLPIVGGGAWLAGTTPGNGYYSGPKSKNFDGRVFFNPNGSKPNKFTDLIKWQLTEKRAKWPETYDSPFANAKPKARVGPGELEITMVGHATLLIQTDGLNFLTDPVFSDRASPVSFAGPKRVNQPGVAIDDLPPIDAILLSHNHYDHLDIESLNTLVKKHNARIITPLGNDAIILKSVPSAKIETGNWGDHVALNQDTKVHFEPIHHWSARGTRDRRMALWAAHVIETPAGNVYFVGDTGFHDGINYRAAGEKYGRFRAAILPIGAYSPRWFMKNMHQNPEEAVEGHMLCNAEVSIAHHWGTFQLTNEPIEEPIERLATAMETAGLKKDAFITLRPGQNWRAQSANT